MSLHPSALETREVTLFDLLDTALDKGIVVQGDATLSVADVDLVFLGLKLVLTSVETMESWRKHEGDSDRGKSGSPTPPPGCPWRTGAPPVIAGRGDRPATGHRQAAPAEAAPSPSKRRAPQADGRSPTTIERLAAEPEKAERGLAKLVLTVVELLRRLLEEQAVRRMEGGSLSEEEIERMGGVFQRLEDKMAELKRVFGLEGEELNLDLGPLGKLM